MKYFTPTIFAIVASVLLILSLSFNIFLLFDQSQKINSFNQRISLLEQQRSAERANRDKIKNFWSSQAETNDILLIEQNNLFENVRGYFDEVDRGIRFVNTVPNILPTISEVDLRIKRQDINQKIGELQNLKEENADKKQDYKNQIDEIYKNSAQDQNNTANPDEGIR